MDKRRHFWINKTFTSSISGWAFNSDAPNVPVEVRLILDGIVLASVKASSYRAHLEKRGYSDGRHGFKLGFPLWLFDGVGRDFEVEFVEIDQTVTVKSVQLPDYKLSARNFDESRSMFGFVQEVSTERIRGWVLDLHDPNHQPDVTLVIAGRPIVTAKASLLSEIIPARDQRWKQHGFEFGGDVLRHVSNAVEVSILLAEGSVEIPPGKVVYDPFESDIDIYQDIDVDWDVPPPRTLDYRPAINIRRIRFENFTLSVKGWVLSETMPGLPLRVSLFVDGVEVDQVLASRKIISADVESTPDGAFEFELSCLLYEVNECASVYVSVDNTKTRIIHLDTERSVSRNCQLESARGIKNSRLAQPTDCVVGSVDKVSLDRISGWAMIDGEANADLGLALLIDGNVYAYTQPSMFRADIANRRGTHGYHGFLFKIAPNFAATEKVALEVRPLTAASRLSGAVKNLTISDSASLRLKGSISWHARTHSIPGLGRPVTNSCIVLTRNGSAVVASLLKSAQLYRGSRDAEWIIVDHNSTDDTSDIVASASRDGLNIQYYNRDRNYSFSESNNFAATHANGENLIFINNDIILNCDSVSMAERCLSDDGIGIVGIKLLDFLPSGVAAEGPIQHMGVFFNWDTVAKAYRPYEARASSYFEGLEDGMVEVPAVTGAFLAMRKRAFEKAGGFSGEYFYGYEDIDLCLKSRQMGLKNVYLGLTHASHYRGYTRIAETRGDPRRNRNKEHFKALWGSKLRRLIRSDSIMSPGFWTGVPLKIAFAVTEVGQTAVAADFFTALELGKELNRQFGFDVRFLDEQRWYELSDVDIVIAMVDKFDPCAAKACTGSIVCIAWARNWFDRWCRRPYINDFSEIWASSRVASDYMKSRLGRDCSLLRTAASWNSSGEYLGSEEYKSDYCFTGNRFGAAREVEYCLEPAEIRGVGRLFGHNWEGTQLSKKLPVATVPYEEILKVYASTEIVIDDSNVATKPFGSVNSRVFDALAMGKLVLSNCQEGVQELFGDMLPTWDTKESLTRHINAFLSNPTERERIAEQLQLLVLREHTYTSRAQQARNLLVGAASRLRLSIKIAPKDDVASTWGDFHFSHSLASALRVLGYVVRVDPIDRWYCSQAESDDIVIVLRGLQEYKINSSQLNFLWLISHPEDVSITEMNTFDHVFIASDIYYREIFDRLQVPCSPLLQCTDASRFGKSRGHAAAGPRRAVFVGNSRMVFRPFVKWAVEERLDVSVFGRDWEKFIPQTYLKGDYVPNNVLGDLYSRFGLVLCDHWDDMKRLGFVSNRIFDAIASGAAVISDNVAGIKELVGGYCTVVETRGEFIDAITGLIEYQDVVNDSAGGHTEGSAWVLANHTFADRARAFDQFIKERLG